MLNYNPIKRPLVDPDKLVFTKGVHQFESIEDVAESDPGYLIFIVEKSKTDQASIDIIQEFIEAHPDYFDDSGDLL